MKRPVSVAPTFLLRGLDTGKATHSKTLAWKAAALVGGLGLGMLSYPVNAASTSGGDTVQSLYDALLSTMKNARTLGQSGRFTQLAPVIRLSGARASRIGTLFCAGLRFGCGLVGGLPTFDSPS